MTDMCVKTEV